MVVVIHGLWNRGAESWLLRRRLASRCGVPVRRFRYPSTEAPFERNVGALRDFIGGLEARPVGLIGHSLGGLLALAALAGLPPGRVTRAVLLGPPLAGSRVVHRLLRMGGPGRWLTGASGEVLATGLDARAPDGTEIGIIAGTRAVGMGRAVIRFDGPSDGTVAVAETRLEGASDRCHLPVSHTGMLFSREVAERASRFLLTGGFGA